MDSDLKTITLPDTVTYIEGCAFYGCKNLARITIPNSLISIGSSAFENCTGLNGVYLSDINTWFKIDFSQSFSNPIYYAHVLYLNDEILTELDIPDGTTNISKNAFIGCSSLTSVKVPKSVTNIGSEAFYMCTNLTSVTVLDSVNSIGKWAFYGCDNLTIYGYDNSFAQSYAADNSIPFIIVSDDEADLALAAGLRTERTIGYLAKKMGKTVDEIMPLADNLVQYGIFRRVFQKDLGEDTYYVQIFAPGILEMMVNNKKLLAEHPEVGRAFEEYTRLRMRDLGPILPQGYGLMRVCFFLRDTD